MFEDAAVPIACPRCECPMVVPLPQVMFGGGVFCPACKTHISFIDERAGLRVAGRSAATLLSEKITIEVRL